MELKLEAAVEVGPQGDPNQNKLDASSYCSNGSGAGRFKVSFVKYGLTGKRELGEEKRALSCMNAFAFNRFSIGTWCGDTDKTCCVTADAPLR